MSKIKNGGFDQYGAGPFEQQQFETAGIEGVKDGRCSSIFSRENLLVHRTTAVQRRRQVDD